MAGKPAIESQSCIPKTVVQTTTVVKEVCTATSPTGNTTTPTGMLSYGFPTPDQATTASQTLTLQLSYPTADTLKADWVVFSGKVTKNNKAGAYYVTFWDGNRLIMVLRTDFNGTFSYKFTRLSGEAKGTMNLRVYAVDSDGKGVSNVIQKVITAP